MRTRTILLGILLAGVAAAQGRGGSRNSGVDIPTAPTSPKNHFEQMATALQLTKDQKKDVKSLMDEAQKEAAPIRDELAKSRAQIAAAIQGGKQEEIDGAVKSYSELQAQMGAIEMKAFAGIYKELDQDQKQKSRAVFVMMPGIFCHKNWVDVEQQ